MANGKPNGAIARVCDELGDIELELKRLETRRIALREELMEEARRTKQNRFEGKRFDASVWMFDNTFTRYKDCFEVLARQTGATDEQQRKIIRAHTSVKKGVSHARAFIPKAGPKRRI